jgi:hypothetical protein
VFSFLGNTLILSLATRCSANVLSPSVAEAMDFTIPAFRHCLRSRCLAMIFHKPLSSDGRLIRHSNKD